MQYNCKKNISKTLEVMNRYLKPYECMETHDNYFIEIIT